MVVVVNYDTLESLPPIMSLLLVLKKLGHKLHFIGMASDAGESFLARHEIPFTFLPPVRRCKANRLLDYICRAPSFLIRRKFLKNKLDELRRDSPDLAIWFQQLKTAALLGNYCFDYPKRVLTFFELYDRIGTNWFAFSFERFVRTSTIVVPEYNRAWMLKSLLNLSELPFVVANKPSEELVNCPVEMPETVAEIFTRIGDRAVFLYQGALGADRVDVIDILEAIAKNRPSYVVLMLTNKTVGTERLRNTYHNVYWHPIVPAPQHLSVTRHADVGIAVYNGGGSALGQLNAVYCAPNKIYEYAAFGVPTLGNNIPGLKYSIEASGAGLCCDIKKDSILDCADQLISSHDMYSEKSRRFYRECNLFEQISNVIDNVL